MENNILFINATKDNFIDFDLTVQGIEEKETYVYLIIETTNNITVGFEASRQNDNKWSVKIPPLPFLEKTTYNYHICTIVDGYHFTPLKGTVTITGSQEVYITNPQNTTLQSTVSPVDPPASAIPQTTTGIVISVPTTENETPKKKWREKSIAEIASEITKTAPPKKIIVTESATDKNNPKDDAVKEILKEFGAKGNGTVRAIKPPSRLAFRKEKVVVR
ncbi:MAG: hypothetical protein ACREAU_00775 [Nitrosopumilaceae archaeon]